MLTQMPRWKAALLSALLVAFSLYAAWTITTASSFQACVAGQAKSIAVQAKEAPRPQLLVLADYAAIYGRCGWYVVYGYRDAVIALCAGLIALFTFTLWRVARRLAEGGERQFGLMQRAVNTAANATAAADRQAAVAERSLEDLERPYIFASRLEFVIATDEISGPHFLLGLTNYGRTPAIMKSYWVELLMKNQTDSQKDDIFAEWNQPISQVIAAGGVCDNMRLPSRVVTEGTIGEIWRGSLQANLTLRLSYDDVFGQQHDESFSYLYLPSARSFVRNDGNESDQDR